MAQPGSPSDQTSRQSENGPDETREEHFEDQNSNPNAEASVGPDSTEETVTIQPVDGARDFTNPLLKGKSPEEIERLVTLQTQTIQSQNQELNNYHTRLTSQNQPAAIPPKEEEADYGDTFIAPQMRTLEDRVTRRLEAMVRPIATELRTRGVQTTRDKLRGELTHFNTLEPVVDQILRQQGVDPSGANEQTLRFVYMTAVGLASTQGLKLDAAPAPSNNLSNQPSSEQPPVNIPQRRPSSAPLAPPNTGVKARQLTESERRMAKEWGMSEEDYLKEQGKEVDEVVQPGFSKDNW